MESHVVNEPLLTMINVTCPTHYFIINIDKSKIDQQSITTNDHDSASTRNIHEYIKDKIDNTWHYLV